MYAHANVLLNAGVATTNELQENRTDNRFAWEKTMHGNKTNQCGSSFGLVMNATTTNGVTTNSKNGANNMRPSSERAVVTTVNGR